MSLVSDDDDETVPLAERLGRTTTVDCFDLSSDEEIDQLCTDIDISIQDSPIKSSIKQGNLFSYIEDVAVLT